MSQSKHINQSQYIGGRSFDLFLFDKNGKYEVKQMNKAKLVAETGLLARDLIVLDSGYHRRPRPVILVRNSAIVVCVSYVRAIIRSDSVYLFQPNLSVVRNFCPKFQGYLNGKSAPFFPTVDLGRGASSQNIFYDLEEESTTEDFMAYQVSSLPFELRALEGILSAVCRQYHNKTTILSPLVKNVLYTLSSKPIEPDVLNQLFPIKNTLSEFEIETAMFRDVLKELIHNEEDMLGMLLTAKQAQQGTLPPEQHNIVELLLENYCSQLMDISQESYYLRKRVESTQSIVELKLDIYRNHMLRLSIQLATGSVALTLGTMMSGYFGANLTSGLEMHPTAFWWLGAFSMGSIASVFYTLSRKVDNSVPLGLQGAMSDSVFNHLDEIQQILGVAHSRRLNRTHPITRAEMSSMLQKFGGIKISNDEMDILFRTFDIDHDGVIGHQEVQRVFQTKIIPTEPFK